MLEISRWVEIATFSSSTTSYRFPQQINLICLFDRWERHLTNFSCKFSSITFDTVNKWQSMIILSKSRWFMPNLETLVEKGFQYLLTYIYIYLSKFFFNDGKDFFNMKKRWKKMWSAQFKQVSRFIQHAYKTLLSLDKTIEGYKESQNFSHFINKGSEWLLHHFWQD